MFRRVHCHGYAAAIVCDGYGIVNSDYDNIPIDNNKILVSTFNGAFTCNPKYIVKELLKRKTKYKIVWVVNTDILRYIKDFPENIDLVMIDTPDYYKELMSAKLLIKNDRRLKDIKKGFHKRKEQIYIQTFHGSLGIKKSGIDRDDQGKKAMEICEIEAKTIDYLTSNGKYTTEFFKRMFWNNGKIAETGHPRNDIFFKDNTEIKEKIYKKYNIPLNKKLVMYAPTFREDYDISVYTLDFDNMIKAFEKKFGGEWAALVRLHPRLLNYRDKFQVDNSLVYDVTAYSDIQELMAVSEAVITDYSSCIYDFMLTRKPGFIYAVDIDKYNNGRGFYYPLTSTPFPVASNNEEMEKNILNFNFLSYKQKVEDFLKEKGCIDDGHASERVVDLIYKLLENQVTE